MPRFLARSFKRFSNVLAFENSNAVLHRKFSITSIPEGQYIVKMPVIMEAKTGIVERWIKAEGEKINASDTICEATLDDLTIGKFFLLFLQIIITKTFNSGIECGHDGLLAKILCAPGDSVNVGEPIAVLVDSKEAYMAYFAEQKETSELREMINGINIDE